MTAAAEDLAGQVINGVRFVESYVHLHASGRKVRGRWRVVCRCGEPFTAFPDQIRAGRTCGQCHPLTGRIVNGIRFVERFQKRYDNDRRVYGRWRVICRCGQEFTATAYEVRVKGRTCGHCHLRKGVPRFGALVKVENAVLLELAETGSRAAVAKALSERLGCKVTKNMVAGRLWRIGASTSKPQPKREPLLPLPGLCAFPMGHPEAPGFAYCDAPIEPGRTYCDQHHRITHLKEGHRDERRPQA